MEYTSLSTDTVIPKNCVFIAAILSELVKCNRSSKIV